MLAFRVFVCCFVVVWYLLFKLKQTQRNDVKANAFVSCSTLCIIARHCDLYFVRLCVLCFVFSLPAVSRLMSLNCSAFLVYIACVKLINMFSEYGCYVVFVCIIY